MTVASAPVVLTVSGSVGDSIKVELSELAGVTDWSLLTVDVNPSVTFTRRTNSLYFKGSVAGDYQIIIDYDGSPVRSFVLLIN